MRTIPVWVQGFALVSVIACESAPSALDPEQILGTYALTKVGAESLPTPPASGNGYTSSITSGSLTFNSDFTYQRESTQRWVWRDGSSTIHLLTESGTWSLGGQAPRKGKLALQDTTSQFRFTYSGQAGPKEVKVWLPPYDALWVYRR
jgi:hypothetical protein